MKTATALALVFFLAAAQAEEKNFITKKDVLARSSYKGNRIVGGTEAQQGQFPWQVGVYYRASSGGLFFCGGSLVSPRYVITAAHCAADATLFSLFLGGTRLNSNEAGSRSIEVDGSEAVIHPNYNATTLNNDLALIRLPEALEESETIKPIRIPQRGEIITVGNDLTVSGWGVTESSSTIVDNLLYAFVNAISNLQCAAVFGTSIVIDTTVCTQGNPYDSPCSGDSGGPLVSYHGADPTLVGVASFIHRDGCASGYPAGYVRIEPQVAFINEVINSEPEEENPEGPQLEPEEPIVPTY